MSDGKIRLTWLESNTSDDLPELIRTLRQGGDQELSEISEVGQPGVLGELRQFLLKDNIVIGDGARHLI
jgi:hypothetical protein